MSRYTSLEARLSSLVLIAVLIWLPRAIGEDATSQPAASQPAATSRASTSQPSDREIELREGRRIIEETAAVYKNCKSYQDEGEVVTVWHSAEGRQTTRKTFETAFVRSGQFRFEARDTSNDPYIVWKNGTDIRTWWQYKPGETNPNGIGVELDVAIGVSSGSANKVPALLLPNEVFLVSALGPHRFFGGAWNSLRNVRFTEQDKSRGVLHDILDAERHVGEPVQIWIDSKTKLVRKVVEWNILPQVRTEITTTYKPKINVDISVADLEFNPPKK